jgi:hypothetical protein
MKIPVFTKEKLVLGLVVISIMAILWGIMRWIGNRTEKTIQIERLLKPFYSEEMRRLPCGRFQKRIVELDGSTGVKRVQLLSPEGKLLKEKRVPIAIEDCTAIGNGQFVPDLWKDCKIKIQ